MLLFFLENITIKGGQLTLIYKKEMLKSMYSSVKCTA